MKQLKFIGSSKYDLRDLPHEARRDAGFQLHSVQSGFDPKDWKQLDIVGPSARELPIHAQSEWRIV